MAAIANAAADRPLPAHVRGDASAATTPTRSRGDPDASRAPFGPDASSSAPPPSSSAARSTHQFHRWFASVDAKKKTDADERFRRHAEVLERHAATCDGLLASADAAKASIDRLRSNHESVVERGRALRDERERLAEERAALERFADALGEKLEKFDELEELERAFQNAGVASTDRLLDPSTFAATLERLDGLVAFIEQRPRYAEFAAFSVKCATLRSRILATVRSRAFAAVRKAAAESRRIGGSRRTPGDGETRGAEPPPVSGGGGDDSSSALSSDADDLSSASYVAFRASVACLRPMMDELDARSRWLAPASKPGSSSAPRPAHTASLSSKKEYAQALADCRATYREERLGAIRGAVRLKIEALDAAEPDLAAFARSACAFALEVNRAERDAYEAAFPPPADADEAYAALGGLAEALGAVVHDAVRPRIIAVSSPFALADLADAIAGEALDEQHLRAHGDAGTLTRPFAEAILADVRERLIFRAQAFVKQHVEAYQASAEDLDYPGKLERAAADATSADENANDDSRAEGEKDIASTTTGEDGAPRRTRGWWPPLENALAALAVLYRSLDAKTFAGMAQETVAACASSVDAAQRLIAEKGSADDARLFAIKHLLILREQLSPFEPELAAHAQTTRELDFSHLRGQMRRALDGELSFFSGNYATNAIAVMATKGAPRVVESKLDAGRELERRLKLECEAYIMAVTRRVVEPLLGFLTKVTALKVASEATERPGGAPGASAAARRTPSSLRDAAFASPAKLKEVVAKTNAALATDLPNAAAKMATYLKSAATREIIFNPIESNVAEAHAQVAALLEKEYDASDRAEIALKSPAELKQIMERALDPGKKE